MTATDSAIVVYIVKLLEPFWKKDTNASISLEDFGFIFEYILTDGDSKNHIIYIVIKVNGAEVIISESNFPPDTIGNSPEARSIKCFSLEDPRSFSKIKNYILGLIQYNIVVYAPTYRSLQRDELQFFYKAIP